MEPSIAVTSPGRGFEEFTIEERFRWLLDTFGDSVAASTSFGAQSVVLLRLLQEHAPEVPVVFIDTGYLFPETYRYADQLMSMFDLDIRIFQPLMTSARLEALHGKLWEKGPGGAEEYSRLTKVEPMNRALRELGAKAWVSGMRRSQSQERGAREFVEKQKKTTKIYPILDWSNDEVQAYIDEHDLPRHPLVSEGYVSIGDVQSTRPLEEGMNEEDTRFDSEKRECGLHLPSTEADYQI